MRLTFGFRSIARALRLAQPPGSQPGREVPDDHCRPIHRARPIQPVFTDAERLALAGFLAGYRGLTCDAYTPDLRQFTTWCRARSLALFAVRRADIESFARHLEAKGRARATVTRRQCTIVGFYKYAVEEEDRPPCRNRQDRHTPHAETRIHHRRARRRGPAARCARGRVACRPANDDAVRPGPRQPRSPRHLHRRGLRRGRCQVNGTGWKQFCLAAARRQTECPSTIRLVLAGDAQRSEGEREPPFGAAAVSCVITSGRAQVRSFCMPSLHLGLTRSPGVVCGGIMPWSRRLLLP
jgi:hypothetical protein